MKKVKKLLKKKVAPAVVAVPVKPRTPWPEGVTVRRIFWVRGTLPKGMSGAHNSLPEVREPPCCGWQHAVVMASKKGSRFTILCPYSLTAYSVSSESAEIASSVTDDLITVEKVVDSILAKWREFRVLGMQKDYNEAAAVLQKLGAEVPTDDDLPAREESDRRKGGKPAADQLLREVDPAGKRGVFLRWFLDRKSGVSVREAMSEFDMTRSNALSYLHMLNKDHGVGYELSGDAVTVTLPKGCESPFTGEQSKKTKAKTAKKKVVDDNDFMS